MLSHTKTLYFLILINFRLKPEFSLGFGCIMLCVFNFNRVMWVYGFDNFFGFSRVLANAARKQVLPFMKLSMINFIQPSNSKLELF